VSFQLKKVLRNKPGEEIASKKIMRSSRKPTGGSLKGEDQSPSSEFFYWGGRVKDRGWKSERHKNHRSGRERKKSWDGPVANLRLGRKPHTESPKRYTKVATRGIRRDYLVNRSLLREHVKERGVNQTT